MGEQRRRKELQAAQVGAEDSNRKLWVIAVIAFWVSAVITLTVTLITGKLDLILVCLTLGMMVLGVGLKVRYRLHQRKARSHATNGGSV